jgi:hypothetical protein
LFSVRTLCGSRHDDLDATSTMGILAAVRERLQPEAAGGNHFETPRKPDDTAGIRRSEILPAGIDLMDAIGHGCMHGPSCCCRASR